MWRQIWGPSVKYSVFVVFRPEKGHWTVWRRVHCLSSKKNVFNVSYEYRHSRPRLRRFRETNVSTTAYCEPWVGVLVAGSCNKSMIEFCADHTFTSFPLRCSHGFRLMQWLCCDQAPKVNSKRPAPAAAAPAAKQVQRLCRQLCSIASETLCICGCCKESQGHALVAAAIARISGFRSMWCLGHSPWALKHLFITWTLQTQAFVKMKKCSFEILTWLFECVRVPWNTTVE